MSGSIPYWSGTQLLQNTAGSSGQALRSGGTGAPTFGILAVAGGGSGVATYANTSALITSGTTSTGNYQNIASVATGQVLVSAGTSTLPVWSASPTVTSITFGAGNALNTYVTGAWTPVITIGGSTSGITYSTQVGNYTQIGNMVTIVFNIVLSSKGGLTGAVTVTGLPVTSKTQTGSGLNMPIFFTATDLTATYVSCYAAIASNTTTMTFNQISNVSASSAIALDGSNLTNSSGFGACLHYYAS